MFTINTCLTITLCHESWINRWNESKDLVYGWCWHICYKLTRKTMKKHSAFDISVESPLSDRIRAHVYGCAVCVFLCMTSDYVCLSPFEALNAGQTITTTIIIKVLNCILFSILKGKISIVNFRYKSLVHKIGNRSPTLINFIDFILYFFFFFFFSRG